MLGTSSQWHSHRVEVHIGSQLFTCKCSLGYQKPAYIEGSKCVWWQATDTVTCQAVSCHGSCDKASHGNGMGNMGRVARLCWEGHLVPPSTIWSPLFQDSLAFNTQQHSRPPPSPTQPPSLMPLALMQCYWPSDMFPVIDIILVWPPLSKQCHSSCSTCLQILICPTSSTVTKEEPEERNGKRNLQGRSSCHTKNPPQRGRWRKVWRILNFGEISNGIGERRALRRCSWKPCELSGSCQ